MSDIGAQAPKVGDHIYFLYSGRLSGLVRLSGFYGPRIVPTRMILHGTVQHLSTWRRLGLECRNLIKFIQYGYGVYHYRYRHQANHKNISYRYLAMNIFFLADDFHSSVH